MDSVMDSVMECGLKSTTKVGLIRNGKFQALASPKPLNWFQQNGTRHR